MTGLPRLEIDDLRYLVAGRPLLQGVSFSVAPGELVFLTGSNGSGKTTLVDLLGGDLRQDSGTVSLDGAPLTGPPWERARHGIARLYQSIGLFSGLTVKEALNVGPLALGRGWLTPDRIQELIATMRLRASPQQLCAELSIGQKRILSIGRILAVSPSVMLLDEPATGLATEAKADLANALRKQLEAGCSIVVVEHDEAFIQEFDARRFCLKGGVLCSP